MFQAIIAFAVLIGAVAFESTELHADARDAALFN
jgi:hypothetical protein